jgi:hypothetical protein
MRSWSDIAYAMSAANASTPIGITMRSVLSTFSPRSDEESRSKKRASAALRLRAARAGAGAAWSAELRRVGRCAS